MKKQYMMCNRGGKELDSLSKKNSNYLSSGVVILLALIFPFLMGNSTYPILIANFMFIYIIATSGLDILFGYSGQISMGHAAYYCIGAYGSALLNIYLGLPVLLSMILGAVIGGLIGALMAYPLSKLKFHFLALSTIAFNEIVYLIAAHSPNGITGDYKGLYVNRFSILGFELKSNFSFYYFALFSVILFLLGKQFLINSNIGRAMIAVRESTSAANGIGINVRKYKVIAFAFSAFYTAFAGAMYAHMVEFISPETFFQKQSVIFMTMLLFGGTGSLWGPIIGSASVLLLTEALRSFQELQMLVYGILLLLVIVLIPGGLYGFLKTQATKIKKKMNLRKEEV